jgi:hypothetical protein
MDDAHAPAHRSGCPINLAIEVFYEAANAAART